MTKNKWRLPDTLATCDFHGDDRHDHGGYFKIMLKDGNFELVHQLLIHEYAHAVSWWDISSGDHDAEFGIAYAKCYRIVMENAKVDGHKLRCQQ